jgi:voltage-gated potassium channel
LPEEKQSFSASVESVRCRIFNIIEDSPHPSVWAPRFNLFMSLLIVLNISAVILESVQSLADAYNPVFGAIDVVSVLIFTVEYILRLWTCTLNPQFHAAVTGRVRFALTPMSIIDLLAILPFYLPMIIPVDLRMMRALRLMRLVRILKIGRYSEAAKTFQKVIVNKKEEILLALLILLIVLVFSSSLMYTAEHEAQPDKFPDIPHAMWWGIVTLATVGYGDVYPITPLGQFLGGIVLIVGIGVFALPTGIFASGFIDVINERRQKTVYVCPYCGKHHDAEGNKVDPDTPPSGKPDESQEPISPYGH